MKLALGFDLGGRGHRVAFQPAPPVPRAGQPAEQHDAPPRAGGLRIAHVTPYDVALSGGVNATVRELVVRQRRSSPRPAPGCDGRLMGAPMMLVRVGSGGSTAMMLADEPAVEPERATRSRSTPLRGWDGGGPVKRCDVL